MGTTYMRLDKTEWFKGSLSTWLIAILMPVLGFAGRSLVVSNQEFHYRIGEIVDRDSIRITRIEEQVVSIRASQERIETELRSLNSWLRSDDRKEK